MINKFISGLSDLGKKLLALAMIIIICALFDRLLIGPTMSRIEVLDEETSKEKEAIKSNLRFLSYKDRIMKESKSVQSYITENVPSEDETISAFLKKIEITAGKANVVLAKVTPSTGQQEGGNLKYSADLECSGKLIDVVTFMHLINTADELTKVTKYNLGSKKSDSDDIKATMSISKIIVSNQPIANPASSLSSSNTQSDASIAKKN